MLLRINLNISIIIHDEMKGFAQLLHRPQEFRNRVISQDGVRAWVTSDSDLACWDKIFRREEYGIIIDFPALVFDVGMHVGYASLYFARNPQVKVIGFEPFRQTFQRAQANFSLNPDLQGRIDVRNYGLAGRNMMAHAAYCYGKNRQANIYEAGDEVVEVRDASEIFRKAREAHQGREIILKMDCQGAEYEIFDSMESSGELKHILAMAVFYHNGAERLERHLRGWHTLMTRQDNEKGCMYAFRKS